ncbi:hypothetical protein ACIP5Y_21785 [Nocardia sp. NPDC088792]|uniref:hypothetical protein n=1 Tax=Nocardia sp. NPDC088792 TaxID=3364332 RepID=UPI0038250EA8
MTEPYHPTIAAHLAYLAYGCNTTTDDFIASFTDAQRVDYTARQKAFADAGFNTAVASYMAAEMIRHRNKVSHANLWVWANEFAAHGHRYPAGWSVVDADTSHLHRDGYHATIDYSNSYIELPWRVTDYIGNTIGEGIGLDGDDARDAAEYAIVAHQTAGENR